MKDRDMTMFRTRHRWFRLAAAAALAACAGQAAAAPARADAPDTIVVDRAHPFSALPGDFVGLSYEMRELATQCTSGICTGGFDASRGNLVTLLRNFGRSNVRIAGNQLDRDTLWVPAGQAPPDPLPTWVKDVVTPADIARLDGLLRVTGWKAEVGVNLAHYDPALAADEARTEAVRAARSASVAVVFVGEQEAEGVDRTDLRLPGYQDQLVSAVAAANPHTIVVLNTGGPVLMPWLQQVTGVLEAWYPGEEDGNAIAAPLFGDADPAGRLPITFPQSLADTPAADPAQYPGVNGVATYTEGVFVGYRHDDAAGIRPLFPFGYGLSYTGFRLGRLRDSVSRDGVTVRVEVTNTGRRTGSQVVQVYAGIPGSGAVPEPPHQLAGFAKVTLRPGQAREVVVRVAARAFAHWDTAAGRFVVPDGTYRVYAGTSSADLPLSATVRLTGVRP